MWQPIETAPKDGTDVVLFGRYMDRPVVGYWVSSLAKPFAYEGWTTGWTTSGGYDSGYDKVYPTHWAPIPPLRSV